MNTRTGSERLALAALAALAWFGVLLQLWLSLRFASNNGESAVQGLVKYFGYFTVLTNIFVAIIASARMAGTDSRLGSESLRGCATTAILFVGLGYHFLLRNVWNPQGWQWLANFILHYAVPLATLAYWLLFPPRERLPALAPLTWGAYPSVYFIYAILRGALIGSYPYYFIDVDQLGYAKALANAIALLAVYIALGFAVGYIARLRTIRVSQTRHSDI